MTSKQHHKHDKIARASLGNYNRNEWAILGSTCEVIQTIADAIIKGLSPQFTAAYLDASHKSPAGQDPNSAIIEYVSHPHKDEFTFNKKTSAFASRNIFSAADIALINGNHLAAKAQVVIIDEQK